MKDRLLTWVRNPHFWLVVWVVLAAAGAVIKYYADACLNYDTFTSVFTNSVQGHCLYEFRYDPEQVFLHNHYGIVFGLLIAPFAILPKLLGVVLWMVVSVGVLFYSLKKLELKNWAFVLLLWFTLNELYGAVAYVQYTILVTAFMVLAFVLTERGREFWATLFIALGAFTKIYGIGALVFFFFAKDKKKFVWSFLLWSAVLFVLPALMFGFDFMIQSYRDWAADLSLKSGGNMFNLMQNVSVVGMVRKISGVVGYSDLWVVVPGLVLYLLPLLRVAQYRCYNFRLSVLASTLMFIVLFSNGSESCTYIMAFVGVGLWYAASPTRLTQRGWNLALMVLVFVVSSLSPTDLFPKSLYLSYIQPYALKALPVFLVWGKMIYEMLRYPYTGDARNGMTI